MSYTIPQKILSFFLAAFMFTSNALFAMNQDGLITLEGVQMNVIKTAENGVANHDTIFLFSQNGKIVSAEYQGGKILKGFLVGELAISNQLEFSYCQIQIDGKLDNGRSICQLSKDDNGKITLTEYFEWESRPGEFGTNIFREL